jgi:hypothetical protein
VVAGATDTTCNGVFYVVSVGSSTTFTYASTGTNSSGTAGTAAPERQMFALDMQPGTPGLSNLHVVFWYPVSVPLQLASFSSSVPSTIPHPATAAEQTALVAGILVEENLYLTIPANWAVASLEAYIQALYTARLAARNALPQPGQYEGYWFDNVAWSQ